MQTNLMGVHTVLVQTEKPVEVEQAWHHHFVGWMHFYRFSRRCHLQPQQMPMGRMKNLAHRTKRLVLWVHENSLVLPFWLMQEPLRDAAGPVPALSDPNACFVLKFSTCSIKMV